MLSLDTLRVMYYIFKKTKVGIEKVILLTHSNNDIDESPFTKQGLIFFSLVKMIGPLKMVFFKKKWDKILHFCGKSAMTLEIIGRWVAMLTVLTNCWLMTHG